MKRKLSSFLTSHSKILLSTGIIGSVATGILINGKEILPLSQEVRAAGTCPISTGGHISGPSRDSSFVDLCASSTGHVSGVVNGHLSQIPDCATSQPFGGKLKMYTHCSSANGVDLTP